MYQPSYYSKCMTVIGLEPRNFLHQLSIESVSLLSLNIRFDFKINKMCT